MYSDDDAVQPGVACFDAYEPLHSKWERRKAGHMIANDWLWASKKKRLTIYFYVNFI